MDGETVSSEEERVLAVEDEYVAAEEITTMIEVIVLIAHGKREGNIV